MNEQNAHSYDLLQAKQLLDVLYHKPLRSSREPQGAPATPNYSRLSAVALPPKTVQAGAAEQAPVAAATEEPELQLVDFDSWESCIAWCMSATRAEAAFVVDSQGFVIASRGRIPSQGFEGTGAEMICSIEQLERIAPDAGKILFMDVDFDKQRITGFVASSENMPLYVVGLVAPEPLRIEVKNKIALQILKNLQNLD